jgi:hypothetical protein
MGTDSNDFGPEKKFKTLPSGDGGFHFITGGDVGVTETAANVLLFFLFPL